MNGIKVVGIGPGHPDYILPAAIKALKEADCVIGGRRQIQAIESYNKNTLLMEGNYKEIILYILEHYKNCSITVAVSGDTGFYSLLGYLKRNLENVKIDVIPGISSLQYLSARLGLSWENTTFFSSHGRALSFNTDEEHPVGILTDRINTPTVIAKKLLDMNKGEYYIVVGEDLSYACEKITIEQPAAILNKNFNPLNVVLILPTAIGIQVKEE